MSALGRTRGFAIAVVALSAAIAAAWFATRLRGGEPAESVPRTDESSARELAAANVELADSNARREATVDAPIVAPLNGLKLHGVVLDITGASRGDVAIEHQRGKSRRLVARSDDTGAFEAVVDKLDGVLTVADGAWVCITPCKLSAVWCEKSHVLVVGRAMALTGRVIDERGDGVARASVGVRMTVEIKGSLPKSIDVPSDVLATATCDDTGDFTLPRFARVPGARLQANSEPLVPHGQELPLGDEPVLIVLRDPEDAKLVHGVVVDTANQPLAAVEVSIGQFGAKPTEADGAFRLAMSEGMLKHVEPGASLEARLEGFQPAHVDGFARLALDATEPLPSQRLILLAPDLHIRGRVVDARGQSMELQGIAIDSGPTSGAASRYVVDQRFVSLDDPSAFDVRGLCDGEYVLVCTTREPRLHFKSEPIRAGSSDVVLRVPADLLVERVLGRVVTLDGNVVPNAKVGIAIRSGFRDVDAEPLMDATRDPVVCDAAGGFELRNVPRREGFLVITHPSIVATAIALESLDFSSDLRIVVPRVSFFRIEGLAPNTGMVGIALFDAQGRTVRLKSASNGAILDGISVVTGGKSETFVVAEGRYTLACSNRGSDTGFRREIELVGGETLVVTP